MGRILEGNEEMSKLIKIDDVLECIEDAQDGSKKTYDILADVFNRVLALPSAEAVEVVRCKGCKYWHGNTEFCDMWSHLNIAQRTLADDYCSLGERKGGDNE